MFGLSRRKGRHVADSEDESDQPGYAAAHGEDVDPGDVDGGAGTQQEPGSGPYDVSVAPGDEIGRLDLGSVRIPVPDEAQLQVEVDPAGPVRAVHVVTEIGRLTVSGFAAPTSSSLWEDVHQELSEQLRSDGAQVHALEGPWGVELKASTSDAALRFVGVDGPRWLLRGVASGPEQHADEVSELLHRMLAETIVVRGDEPLPVRTPLPIELPEPIASHIQQAQQEQDEQ